MQWILAVLTSLLVLLSPSVANAHEVPAYDGLVNDFANVLPDDRELILEQELTAYAEATAGAEIAVVTIQTLDGEPIENRTLEFFDAWGIGKKGRDNGVLLLISVEDRELRIHTGYGVEAALPDSVADRIIRDEMVPKLKDSDYMGAATAGVASIQKNLQGKAPAPTNNIESSLPIPELLQVGGFAIVLFVMAMSYLAAFLGRTTSWWLGGVIGAVLGLLFLGAAAMLLAGGVGLLLDYILSKNYKRWNLEGKQTSWARTLGGFHSTSSSKGFSFGGGRSGGGGASGKW